MLYSSQMQLWDVVGARIVQTWVSQDRIIWQPLQHWAPAWWLHPFLHHHHRVHHSVCTHPHSERRLLLLREVQALLARPSHRQPLDIPHLGVLAKVPASHWHLSTNISKALIIQNVPRLVALFSRPRSRSDFYSSSRSAICWQVVWSKAWDFRRWAWRRPERRGRNGDVRPFSHDRERICRLISLLLSHSCLLNLWIRPL